MHKRQVKVTEELRSSLYQYLDATRSPPPLRETEICVTQITRHFIFLKTNQQ